MRSFAILSVVIVTACSSHDAGSPRRGAPRVRSTADSTSGRGQNTDGLRRITISGCPKNCTLTASRLIRPLAKVDRRRPYELTAAGQAVLREQLTQLGSFAAMGLARLEG